MVLEKLGNLTDPISPAECDDRIIFIESEELFVHRCERTNAAFQINFKEKKSAKLIHKTNKECEKAFRPHPTVFSIPFSKDVDLNNSKSELEKYSFHCIFISLKFTL